MEIGFRPAEPRDLPLLSEWIGRPHWQEWWGDAEEEVALIRDMVEGRDTTRPYLIVSDGRPAGYIQVWSIADQTEEWAGAYPWLAELPQGAVGVDLSLAEVSQLGHGIGSAALAAFAQGLRADGHRDIFIDPDRDNVRAIRAYAKAGFRPVPRLEGRTGDVVVMQFAPEGDGT